MNQISNELNGRGSLELWLRAAFESLLEGGVDSVKIQPLAKKLNLSRASFYWYFKDREELLQALIGLWREKNTGNFIERTTAYAENIVEAILNVSDCWFDTNLFDSKFEFSVRSWALQSDEILAEVQKADQKRIDALAKMFSRFGQVGVAADVRARTVYLLQIGYISMQVDEDIKLRMSRMSEYVQVFTGIKPEEKELARFFSRHNYIPQM